MADSPYPSIEQFAIWKKTAEEIYVKSHEDQLVDAQYFLISLEAFCAGYVRGKLDAWRDEQVVGRFVAELDN